MNGQAYINKLAFFEINGASRLKVETFKAMMRTQRFFYPAIIMGFAQCLDNRLKTPST